MRYYFDLSNHDALIRDDEGVDTNSPTEAFEEARAALSDLRGSGEAPEPGSGWKLIIRDEIGMTLSAISLDDVPFH